MNVREFVYHNQLQPADAIMLRKKFAAMVDHFVVFVGYVDNHPRFMANHKDGVSFVSDQEMAQYATILEPQRIDRFTGTEQERRSALQRAFSAFGKPYKVLSSNCEHFKEWVQRGAWKSPQVKTGAQVASVAGAGMLIGGLASRNKGLTIAGLGILIAGAIISSVTDDDK